MKKDVIFFAVTTNGNFFRMRFDNENLLHVHCIVGNMKKSHSHHFYALNEFTIDLNESSLGIGDPYGLIIYQRSRPSLRSAGETSSLGHQLETGAIIALVKEEGIARWFADGAKNGLITLDAKESESAERARLQTQSIIRECMAYSENFIPDWDILKKYGITRAQA